MFGINC